MVLFRVDISTYLTILKADCVLSASIDIYMTPDVKIIKVNVSVLYILVNGKIAVDCHILKSYSFVSRNLYIVISSAFIYFIVSAYRQVVIS